MTLTSSNTPGWCNCFLFKATQCFWRKDAKHRHGKVASAVPQLMYFFALRRKAEKEHFANLLQLQGQHVTCLL